MKFSEILTSVRFRSAILLLLLFAVPGCSERNYKPIAGSPDGHAEVLQVGSKSDSSIEHVKGSFQELVQQSNRVVLVDFWGPHCGPCVHLASELEQIAQKYPDLVSVVKVDVESAANAELALFFDIRAIPEMRVFLDGKSMGAIHGYARAAQIEQKLAPAIARVNSDS